MTQRSVTISLTLILAVIAAVTIHTKDANDSVHALIESKSSIDVQRGIARANELSFDECKKLFVPLLLKHPEYASDCEEIIIPLACMERRQQELHELPLSSEMLEALAWWCSSANRYAQTPAPMPEDITPWLYRLAALQQNELSIDRTKKLTEMPMHDRDGSVIIAALCLDKFLQDGERKRITKQLLDSTDHDDVLTGLLLSCLSDDTNVTANAVSPEVHTISTILATKDERLAWRTLHNEDGTIQPNQMLVCLKLNRNAFTDKLIESAQSQQWAHPEHPIELAKRFYPLVTSKLPTQGLSTVKSRADWWQKFKCGYLMYQGLQNDEFNCP